MSKRISITLNGSHRVLYYDLNEDMGQNFFCEDNRTLYLTRYSFMSLMNLPYNMRGDAFRMLYNGSRKGSIDELIPNFKI